MPGSFHIAHARIVNEGEIFEGDVLTRDGRIAKIIRKGAIADPGLFKGSVRLDAAGKLLLPGVIDDQVHFREPGLTHKGEIFTESRAAVAGGVTSYMEMPNTQPQTLTQSLLDEKYRIGADRSLANYSFYMGASNDNLDEILKTDPEHVCGLKVFMGASTGNMLVDDPLALKGIYSRVPFLVATHCEDEPTIISNAAHYRKKYGDDVPMEAHPMIRSVESCYLSSSYAVRMAEEYGTRLHVLHLSTAREMELFDNTLSLEEKRITAEVCVHHLWFTSQDHSRLGGRIKWNPAIKSPADREGLWEALNADRIDVVATDHAPHTAQEKAGKYFSCPSGGPLVQHSLVAMLEASREGRISLERVVEKMCHAPAVCFQVRDRGFIREGYWADLVLVDPGQTWEVAPENLFYKCGWSPFDGQAFNTRVTHTFVNGDLAYESEPSLLNGHFNESLRGMRLDFNR
jgi:dihydroorotase